uniref:SET domain-containing protein n=2 Tax=Tetraselmis sp. GSL018 TaxID=582737 RepID=A0A061RU05_9CHLO|mmetsp:Transcript_42281/g.100317  ORF Transcript_42281/g.100317 Transcript_42281/m.100317 type:complete len:104 (-) Transcript_42281:322-633(-)
MAAKAQRAPSAGDYCFVTDGGVPLDPTDSEGELSAWPEGSLWPLPDDVTLARVNEPPPGRGVNAEPVTMPHSRRVVFVAIRDVAAGEELFIDYGPNFSRAGYG